MVNGKKVHYVSAGCQDHSVEDWLNNNIRTKIMRANGFQRIVNKISTLSSSYYC